VSRHRKILVIPHPGAVLAAGGPGAGAPHRHL